MNFNFKFSTIVSFGINSRLEINEIVKEYDFKSICLVIDHALKDVSIINDFIEKIESEVVVVYCDISEPTYDKLEQKRLEVSNLSLDAFIGIGGGSAIDMAKGLSVLKTNLEPAIKYRGFNKYSNTPLPVIAIPTTAGTGSEITPNASFIDSNEKKKLGINGEGIRPKHALIDPELTLSCPLAPTISAGVDSLVHATEAFVAKKTNPMARIFSKEGFKLVIDSLPMLSNDLNNIKLREKVMYGAFLSAIALMNSGTGPAAALSYPLGVHFGVPHGLGGAIFLPHVIEHNISMGYLDYGNIYNLNSGSDSEIFLAEKLLGKIFDTWDILKISKNLGDHGVKTEHIEMIKLETLDLIGALEQNPVPFFEKEIEKTLNKLI